MLKVYRITNNDACRQMSEAWYVVGSTPDGALTTLLAQIGPRSQPRINEERDRLGWYVQELGPAYLPA